MHVPIRNLPLFIAEKALPYHRKTFSATPQRLFRHTERAFPQARKASLAEEEKRFCGVIRYKQLYVNALTNRRKTRVFTAVNCHARKKRSIPELPPHKYAYAGRIWRIFMQAEGKAAGRHHGIAPQLPHAHGSELDM